jgi:selenium metabolism protein YedF
MEKINALGDVCPVPVIKAKNAMKGKAVDDGIVISVDNAIATENLLKLAQELNYSYSINKIDDKNFEITLVRLGENMENAKGAVYRPSGDTDTVVVISSDKMGVGDDELGAVLMKGFIYALTELDTMPKTMLFYNSGAKLTVSGSKSLDDIKALEDKGVTILTCGTCLNFFNITDKLSVGSVTNMYTIAEIMKNASNIIRP